MALSGGVSSLAEHGQEDRAGGSLGLAFERGSQGVHASGNWRRAGPATPRGGPCAQEAQGVQELSPRGLCGTSSPRTPGFLLGFSASFGFQCELCEML